MAVIAVGDFDASRVDSLVREHFEGLAGPVNPPKRIDYGVPMHSETLFSIVADPEVTETTLAIYYKHASRIDPTIGGLRASMLMEMYQSMLS
ncbi:MAG TPA: hypothetical protein VF329_01310 [Gammaproteobacteria bacterium]